MKIVGKHIDDFVDKYHTINGETLRGWYESFGADDNGVLLFMDNETARYRAGVWHTPNGRITKLYQPLTKEEA
tara:strand:+ start:1035 stop:1253 length:219 start_codon:yes stop_codon:yes gene_type:complete